MPRGTPAARSRTSASSIVPGTGVAAPPWLCARMQRMLCWSSAILARCEKVAERAHHLDRALVREAVEGGLKLAARRGIAFPAKRDRDLADALDGREHGLALLLADGVAEHPSDQPDIVSQRPLSIRKLTVIHRAPRSVAPHAAEPNVAERHQIESHTRII